MKMKGYVLACVASLAFASGAVAQEETWHDNQSAEWVEAKIGDGAWNMSPIIVDGTLVGLFGELDPALGKDDNVRLLWAQPDGSGKWVVHGWRHESAERAASWLRKHYMDDSVLTDGIFENDGPIASGQQEPEEMLYGVLESDPALPLLEASESAALAEELVDDGAAGAISLSAAMLSTSECPVVTALDAELSITAMGMVQVLGVNASDDLDSALQQSVGADWQSQTTLASSCWFFCFPSCWDFWGAWSAWSCTGGPTPIAGGGCKFTGCTRSRTGSRVCVSISCATTTTPLTQNQGPQNKTCNDSPPNSGNCAAQPQPGC